MKKQSGIFEEGFVQSKIYTKEDEEGPFILSVEFLKGHNDNLIAFPSGCGRSESDRETEDLIIYDRRRGCFTHRFFSPAQSKKICSVESLSKYVIGVQYSSGQFIVFDVRDENEAVFVVDETYPQQRMHPLITPQTCLITKRLKPESDKDFEFQIIDWTKKGKILFRRETKNHFLYWSFEYEKRSKPGRRTPNDAQHKFLVTYGGKIMSIWKIVCNDQIGKSKEQLEKISKSLGNASAQNRPVLVLQKQFTLERSNYYGVKYQLRNGRIVSIIPTDKTGTIDFFDFEKNKKIIRTRTCDDLKRPCQANYQTVRFPGNLIGVAGEDGTFKLYRVIENREKKPKIKLRRVRNVKIQYDFVYRICVGSTSHSNILLSTGTPPDIVLLKSLFLPSEMTEREKKIRIQDRNERKEYCIEKMKESGEIRLCIRQNGSLVTDEEIRIWRFLISNSSEDLSGDIVSVDIENSNLEMIGLDVEKFLGGNGMN